VTHHSVLLRGAYGCWNLGDDALMVACYRTLRQALDPAEITFLSHDEPYVRSLAPGASFVQRLDGADRIGLLVYGGGTQFYSFPLTRKDRRGRLLLTTWRRVTAPWRTLKGIRNRLRGQPCVERIAALGIGIGPFEPGSAQEVSARGLLGKMDFVAARDEASLELCRRWGREDCVLGADLCFLPGLWNAGPANGMDHRRAAQSARIGVIIRDWPHTREGAAYREPLRRVVEVLRADGHSVRFISFSRRADREWTKSLVGLKEDLLQWDPNSTTIDAFLQLLRGFDCLVTARYHGAVFGALVGAPAVCIELEPKLRIASQALGGGARLWRQPFAEAEGVVAVNQLVEGASEAREALRGAVERQADLAGSMADRFVAFVKAVG